MCKTGLLKIQNPRMYFGIFSIVGLIKAPSLRLQMAEYIFGYCKSVWRESVSCERIHRCLLTFSAHGSEWGSGIAFLTRYCAVYMHSTYLLGKNRQLSVVFTG